MRTIPKVYTSSYSSVAGDRSSTPALSRCTPFAARSRHMGTRQIIMDDPSPEIYLNHGQTVLLIHVRHRFKRNLLLHLGTTVLYNLPKCSAEYTLLLSD